MISEMYNTVFNKARLSGIRVVPENAPSLYQECVKAFVAEVNRTNKNGKRISELQFLPTAALVNIFEEICKYPSLRGVLRQELSDPVLFMRIFTGHSSHQLTVDRCLREASLSGKPVLPDLSRNYCDMVRKDPLPVGSPLYMSRILGALKLGTFLHEAGWAASSVDVLSIAKDMISSIEDNRFHDQLKRECMQQLLRAQTSCMATEEADRTCETLLSLIEDVTDVGVLVKSFLQVANHHYIAERVDQCHEWALKTMTLITDSTPMDDVIEVLQLEALFCFSKQRYDLGNMLISQAIHRARSHYGTPHRRYADVLQTYGQCLLQMNAISDAISTFVELLDVTTQLYGRLTPHVPVIQGHIAVGLYLKSQATGRFDMALQHIEDAITMAHQLTPANRQVTEHLTTIRTLVLKGHDAALAATKESKPTKVANYQRFSFSEIREKYFELDASFEAMAC